MVANKKNISVLRDGKAALLAFMPALLTAAASACMPMEASLALPVFGFLIMAVFFGLVVLWWQAETERQVLAMQLVALSRKSRFQPLRWSCGRRCLRAVR